eukprot:3433305-Amphidinium_carterae.1
MHVVEGSQSPTRGLGILVNFAYTPDITYRELFGCSGCATRLSHFSEKRNPEKTFKLLLLSLEE